MILVARGRPVWHAGPQFQAPDGLIPRRGRCSRDPQESGQSCSAKQAEQDLMGQFGKRRPEPQERDQDKQAD